MAIDELWLVEANSKHLTGILSCWWSPLWLFFGTDLQIIFSFENACSLRGGDNLRGWGHSNPNHNWIHWNIHIRKVGEAKNSLLSALMLRWRGSCLCERACTKLKGLKDSCPGERAHTQHNGSLLGERACTWAKGWKAMHPGKRVHPQAQWLSPRQKGLCPDDRAYTQAKEVATRLKGKRARTQAK